VRIWDAGSGQPIGEPLTGHTGSVNAVAVGSVGGGEVIVSGGDDGTVRIWDACSGQPVGEPLTGHTGSVNAVAVGSVAGREVIVSGGDDGTVRIWDSAGKAITTLDLLVAVDAFGLRNGILCIATNPALCTLAIPT
jgi:WD40 repeat protein